MKLAQEFKYQKSRQNWAKINETCPRVQILKVAPKLGKNQ